MRSCFFVLTMALAAITAAPAAAKDSVVRDSVVVELFTSQGCSACPPADALLAELAERDDVIALAFHVDYWNYLGWRDVFSSPANTRRQQAYVDALGERAVYTPQMVIDGESAVVGSRREQVLDEILVAAATPRALSVTIEADGEGITATVEPRAGAVSGRVLYFIIEPPTTVSVGRGENAGRRATFHNAVRTWMAIGHYDGEARRYAAPMPQDARAVVVLVQDPLTQRVLGAARREFEPWASQVLAIAPPEDAIPASQ
jgi:hypothetical protein